MDDDVDEKKALSFHQRLTRIREKIFRNDEAGLCMEGFLDALADKDDDPAPAGGPANRLRTPVRGGGGSSPACHALKDSDARIKSDLSEYRALMVNRSDFEEVATLGRGHFASVSLVREKSRSSSSRCYAMKRMAKAGVSAARARQERTVMSKAKSDWLVKLRFAFQDARFLYLVMEYCPGGDLRTLLDRQDGGKLSEDGTRFYLAEMTLAIHTLHQMGYVHKDIKPENVLLDRFGHIKLADFGSADPVTSRSSKENNRPVGTPNYVSPEILQCLDSNRSDDYDPRKSDFWSMGVVGFEMATGHTPFADEGKKESVVSTYSNIMSNTYNKRMTLLGADLRALLQGLLTDVERRMGYDQLVRHEFFLSVDWDGLGGSCAPFVPDLTDAFDTSHFERRSRHGSGERALLAAARPCDPVVGFSYAGKHAESVRYSRQFGGEDYSDMVSSLRRQNEDLRLKIARLEKEKTRERRESAVRLAAESERKGQEEVKQLRATVKELEGLLSVEREERKLSETKSLELLTEVRKKWEDREEARVSKIQAELKRTSAKSDLLEDELKKALELAEGQKEELRSLMQVKGSLKAKLKECRGKLESTYGKYEEECQKVKELEEHGSILAENQSRNAELEKSALVLELSVEKDAAAALKADLKIVKKELDRAKSVVRDQKETLQFVKEEGRMREEELKEKAREMEVKKAQLEEEKRDLAAQVSRLVGESELAVIKAREKDTKLEELGRLLEKLENRIKPSERLPTKACHCKEELKKAQEELGLAKVDIRILERKNKELEERIKWRVEISKDEKAEREKSEKAAKAATDTAKKLAAEVESAKDDKEKSDEKVSLLEREADGLKKKVAALRVEAGEGREGKHRAEVAERKLEACEMELKKLAELKETNGKLKAMCLELQDQSSQYEAVLEKLESNLARETSARARYEKDCEELGRTSSELRIERNELKSRLAFAESQAREARAKHDDVESAFRREEKEWSRRLGADRTSKEEQAAALRRLTERVSALATAESQAAEEAADLREQNLQLKEEAAELRTTAGSLKESNLRLNGVLEEALKKIERRNAEVARNRETLQTLVEEKERRENESTVHMEQLQKLIEHLRGKCAGLEAQLSKSGKLRKRPAETYQLQGTAAADLLGTPARTTFTPARSPTAGSRKSPVRSPTRSPVRKALR